MVFNIYEIIKLCGQGNKNSYNILLGLYCGNNAVEFGVDRRKCSIGSGIDVMPIHPYLQHCITSCNTRTTCKAYLEECDLGSANSDTGACTTECKNAKCGDGLVYAGVEECDNGSLNSNTGSCTVECKTAKCGDGLLHDGVEACDEGQANSDTGTCTTFCEKPKCGDGFVYAGVEQCDNGAFNNNTLADACRVDCTLPRCGDGVKDSNEACDDGNTNNWDWCNNDCTGGILSYYTIAGTAIALAIPTIYIIASACKKSVPHNSEVIGLPQRVNPPQRSEGGDSVRSIPDSQNSVISFGMGSKMLARPAPTTALQDIVRQLEEQGVTADQITQVLLTNFTTAPQEATVVGENLGEN